MKKERQEFKTITENRIENLERDKSGTDFNDFFQFLHVLVSK